MNVRAIASCTLIPHLYTVSHFNGQLRGPGCSLTLVQITFIQVLDERDQQVIEFAQN